jgi:hypothetical protein
LAAIAYTLVVLGLLSNRLGAVLKMPPYYRWFYVGAGLVGLSLVTYLVHVSLAADPALRAAPEAQSAAAMAGLQVAIPLLYHLPLAVGLTVGVVAAWRYWSWLLRET